MKPPDPAAHSHDGAMALRRQRVGMAVVAGLLVAGVVASRVPNASRPARRVSRDPMDFVVPEAHALLALDLDRARRAGAWPSGAERGCVEALSSRVRAVLVVWPRSTPDAFALVADGDIPPEALQRCAADAGPGGASVRETRYRDLTLLQVSGRAGPSGATVLALPGGPALVGPTETLYAMIDAALASTERRAEPRALDPLWRDLPAAPLRLAVRWPEPDPDAVLPQARSMIAAGTLDAQPAVDLRVATASADDARAAMQRLITARDRWLAVLPEGSSTRALLASASLRVEGADLRGHLTATTSQLAGAVDEVARLARGP